MAIAVADTTVKEYVDTRDESATIDVTGTIAQEYVHIYKV